MVQQFGSRKNTEQLSSNRNTLHIWQNKRHHKRVGQVELGPKSYADLYQDRAGRVYFFDGRNIRRFHGAVA